MDQKARMQGLSPKELVEIIENSQDYRLETLALAEAELESRQLDGSTLATLKAEIRRENDQKIIKERLTSSSPWKDAVNRLIKGKNLHLLIAAIFLLIIVVINLREVVSLIQFVSEDGRSWDWSMVLVVLPVLLYLVSAIGLVLAKKWAWFLSVFMLSLHVCRISIWIWWINQSAGNSFWDLLFQYNQSYFDVAAFGNLLIGLAPLIILLLPVVRKYLAIARWSQFVMPALGIALGVFLFKDFLIPQEPLRIEAPTQEGPLRLEPVEYPNQELIDSILNEQSPNLNE